MELGEILKYLLDLDPQTRRVPEVEQQHRAPRPTPSPDDPPRPYIVRMLKWSDRQHILAAAREKKGLKWKGKPFHVFQDLPVEIQQQRTAYADVKKALRSANIRFQMLYPSRLLVMLNVEKLIYKTPEEAHQDLHRWAPSALG